MRKYTMNFTLHEPVKPHEMTLMDIFKFFFYQKSTLMYNLCKFVICKENNFFFSSFLIPIIRLLFNTDLNRNKSCNCVRT